MGAMWFKDGKWRIGNVEDIGTITQALQTTSEQPCPESRENKWTYLAGNSSEWLDARKDASVSTYTG